MRVVNIYEAIEIARPFFHHETLCVDEEGNIYAGYDLDKIAESLKGKKVWILKGPDWSLPKVSNTNSKAVEDE